MRYAFRLQSTPAALALMGDRKQKIVEGVVKDAEKLPLGREDYAIFDVNLGGQVLKVLVQFQSRILNILTVDEYHKTPLPGSALIN
jgi:hypothetical protein